MVTGLKLYRKSVCYETVVVMCSGFSVLFHDIVLVLSGVTDLEAVKTYAYQPTVILKGVGNIIRE